MLTSRDVLMALLAGTLAAGVAYAGDALSTGKKTVPVEERTVQKADKAKKAEQNVKPKAGEEKQAVDKPADTSDSSAGAPQDPNNPPLFQQPEAKPQS